MNNAGLIRQSPIVDMPEEDWDFILRNNLKSVFLCSKEAGETDDCPEDAADESSPSPASMPC